MQNAMKRQPSEMRCGFRHMASASSVCLDIRESISYAGMQRSERKRRSSKDNWKESERIINGVIPGRKRCGSCEQGSLFSFCQPGSHSGGRGDSHGVARWLTGGWGVIVDILLFSLISQLRVAIVDREPVVVVFSKWIFPALERNLFRSALLGFSFHRSQLVVCHIAVAVEVCQYPTP